jgi:hypothetical protein
MGKIWSFASYNLWSLFSPAVGQEKWHCDLKRGYTKAKKKHPLVQALLSQNTPYQSIGILAQRGVYEFHQDPHLLHCADGVALVAQKLNLSEQPRAVRERVTQILERYQRHPILLGKDIIKLHRGDEGIPQPILINQDGYLFNLYAALDCIFREDDGTLHILDLKTGKSDFDRRQALVYLLFMSHLYPNQPVCASFYNLEQEQASEIITATPAQLQAVQLELSRLAKKHQQQLWQYRRHPERFSEIYPPSPGLNCHYCPFNSICQFSTVEVSA